MDENQNNIEQTTEPTPIQDNSDLVILAPPKPFFDIEPFKEFFQITGGSLFYCLSAVFIAYGISKVMGPVLAGTEGFKSALPCIITLHAYELALLAVLILIVSKKVVDDAISVAVIIALFLIGTSIAAGSVVDKNINAGLIVAIISIALALTKLAAMRRFTKIPFTKISIFALTSLLTCNYLGPVLMARSIAADPSQESARRSLWMAVWLAMLLTLVIVLIEAAKAKPTHKHQHNEPKTFLQSPMMTYTFTIILAVASGVHQYSTAFTFALERVLADFAPLVTIITLLVLELLRHSGKKFSYAYIAIAFIPLATSLIAIWQESVLATSRFGFGLIAYPPVLLALSGLAIAALAAYHKWIRLYPVVFVYAVAVVLTAGFSPIKPHNLNTELAAAVLIIAMLAYGLKLRNQYICVAAVALLCIALSQWPGMPALANHNNFSQTAALAGVAGLGCMALYLVFASNFHKAIRFFAAFCLAVFIWDYLPSRYIDLKYLYVIIAGTLLIIALRLRTKDIITIIILAIPFLLKLNLAAKKIANWRFVIIGFILLTAGTAVSLLKRTKNQNTHNPQNHT